MMTTSMDPVREGRVQAARPGRGRLRGLAWVHALVMAASAVIGLFVVVRYAIHSVRGFRFDERMMLSLGTTP